MTISTIVEGAQIQSNNGEGFELGGAFNRGGEAEIWAIRREPHLVAKLYHNPTKAHEAKVAAMIAKPLQSGSRSPTDLVQANGHPTLPHQAVAWPLQILYQQKRFVGYLMPRIHDSRPIFHYYNPARRARLPERYPWRYFLYRAAQNLAAAVELVHARGHVVGDLNESNVLVNGEALVTLVDTDSFQVERPMDSQGALGQLLQFATGSQIFRCTVGKAEFTAPELQGVDFKTVDRRPEHDNFALAVLIFYLLMEGYHPFAGVRNDNVSVGRVDLHGIKHGLFPYARNNTVEPPPNAPIFMWLDPGLQALFRRCFIEGHSDPAMRPTAQMWRQQLQEAETKLVACPTLANHIYAKHMGRCPYCERTAVPQLVTPRATAVGNSPDTMVLPPVDWQRLYEQVVQRNWMGVLNETQTATKWALLWLKQKSWQGGKYFQQRAISIWHKVEDLPEQLQTMQHTTWVALRQLSSQLQTMRVTAQTYASVGQRWLVGNLAGVPVGGAVALGFHELTKQVESSPALSFTLAPQLLWVICGALFGIALGIGQAWSLRHSLLRWRYLREFWIGVSGLTGALLGLFAFMQIGPDLAGQGGLEQAFGSLDRLRFSIMALGFGATLGYLQSFLLRQQLQLADDGRIWTVANGAAWLLVAEGIQMGKEWHVAQWSLITNSPWLATVAPQVWLWIGVVTGMIGGVLFASGLTGIALFWLLQGPRRGLYWKQVALQLLSRTAWRTLPRRLEQNTLRWGRGLLLLLLLLLLVRGMSALGGGVP